MKKRAFILGKKPKKETNEKFKKEKKKWIKEMKPYHFFYPSKKKRNFNYFTIRGGSLKKIAKKIIPNVPINKKV
jgi:hypothetical protein